MARYSEELVKCCETIAELFEQLALNFKQLSVLVEPEDEDDESDCGGDKVEKKEFNQEVCNSRYHISCATDRDCTDDCDMECPYTKDAEDGELEEDE